jgi:hypothetical protein
MAICFGNTVYVRPVWRVVSAITGAYPNQSSSGHDRDPEQFRDRARTAAKRVPGRGNVMRAHEFEEAGGSMTSGQDHPVATRSAILALWVAVGAAILLYGRIISDLLRHGRPAPARVPDLILGGFDAADAVLLALATAACAMLAVMLWRRGEALARGIPVLAFDRTGPVALYGRRFTNKHNTFQ